MTLASGTALNETAVALSVSVRVVPARSRMPSWWLEPLAGENSAALMVSTPAWVLLFTTSTPSMETSSAPRPMPSVAAWVPACTNCATMRRGGVPCTRSHEMP